MADLMDDAGGLYELRRLLRNKGWKARITYFSDDSAKVEVFDEDGSSDRPLHTAVGDRLQEAVGSLIAYHL